VLDDRYHFGRDFTFLELNQSFLLTVRNNSRKVIEFRPLLTSVLVDNFGRQFRVVAEPKLPSLEPIEPRYTYDPDYRRSVFNTPLETIHDELQRLYERERYLEGQVSYAYHLKENISTQDVRESLISMERELLALERRTLELKREEELKRLKKRVSDKVLFPDGHIYPGAVVTGLVVFDNPVVRNGDYSVKIMFPEPGTEKILEFTFRLQQK